MYWHPETFERFQVYTVNLPTPAQRERGINTGQIEVLWRGLPRTITTSLDRALEARRNTLNGRTINGRPFA